jgi:ribulose-phosphate 3-epimerase
MRFQQELESVEAGLADWHHVDVMDGHFVPNLTYGLPFVKALKSHAKLPLDVHIMVSNPDAVAMSYVEAGADILVFHQEAAKHPHRIAQEIWGVNRKVGIAINPGTAVETCFPMLSFIDLVYLAYLIASLISRLDNIYFAVGHLSTPNRCA